MFRKMISLVKRHHRRHWQNSQEQKAYVSPSVLQADLQTGLY